MSKQIEALKLALEALNRNDYLGWQTNIHVREAIRDALAEQPAQGCDYCNHPQYAGTKCKNCGREKPAQQREPVAWMKDCADFWEHYTYISEASQENYKAEAQMWVEKLRTSPPASKPWVGLTTEDRVEILRARGEASVLHLTEAKLREKNNG